jgi:hypothetical protein
VVEGEGRERWGKEGLMGRAEGERYGLEINGVG